MSNKVSVIVFATVAVLFVGSSSGASRFKRQAIIPTAPSGANLTDILNALNLTTYLQSATPQIQQAIQNLTASFQTQAAAFSSSLQNVTLQGQYLTQGIQTFLMNFQNEAINASVQLNSSISILQNFFNMSSTNASLQKLVNTLGGGNLTSSVQNLQSQLANLTQFLQNGLQQLNSSSSITPAIQQNIQTLSNALNNGTLNQTLATIITNFQGQALTFQGVLNNLQQQTNSTSGTLTTSLQSAITGVQNAFQAFQTQLKNIINGFTGLFFPTTTTTPATIVVG